MARTTPRAPVRLEPLWLRVERNRVKLALFIGGFLLACVLAAEVLVLVPLLSLVFLQGWQAGNLSPSARLAGAVPDVAAWVAAGSVVLGVAYVGVTLARPVRRLLPAIGAERAPPGELLPTKYALKDMAIACGVQVAPEMYVVESTSVNAFVVGRGRERPVCVVTRGLVERFHADEQRAVFAHLMARLRSGDVGWATAVSALMNPIWRLRERQMLAGEGTMFVAGEPKGRGTFMSARGARGGGWLIVWALMTYVLAVVVTELVAAGHRRAHLASAEAADAEGMLLLKEPAAMLRALRRAIECDNRVRMAVPMYAGLFYIWAGDDLADENDPEWRRLDRLREVVGVDGIADAAEEAALAAEYRKVLDEHVPPPPPAAEEARKRSGTG